MGQNQNTTEFYKTTYVQEDFTLYIIPVPWVGFNLTV